MHGVAFIIALTYLLIGRLSSDDIHWVQVNLPLSTASVLAAGIAGVEAYFAVRRWQTRYRELQNTRTREIELAERLAEQRRTILNQISRHLLDKLDLQQIPRETLEHAALLFETDVVAVWVADPKHPGPLEPRGICGLSDASSTELAAIGRATPCFNPVLQQSKQVILDDFRHEAALAMANFCSREGLFVAVLTPIATRGSVIGVLAAFYRQRRQISASLSAEMQTVANILASAIQAEELYRDLAQLQKIDSLANLTGGIAHDFNNVLAAILACVTYVKQNTPTSSPSYRYLESAETSTHRGAALTKQLLSFTHNEGPRPIVLNPNDAIDETIHLLERIFEKQIQLRRHFAPDIARIEINPGQFEQVILNLALNARDAMPTGGTLTLSTHNLHLDSATPSRPPILLADGDYVVLGFHDTGHGMPPAILARIFEPFYTTKPKGKGTGLGLALVRTIVRAAHGDVHVQSEPNRGTHLEIYLPATNQLLPTAITALQAASPGGHECILLIEDEDVIREMTRLTLQEKGYNVLTANEGTTAGSLYKHKWQSIDLVITDMMMPGLTGPELLASLKEINPAVRIIVSSGYSQRREGSQMLQYGCLGYLEKPYRPDDLHQLVRSVLNSAA